MKVSVIIPTHNRPQELTQALNSILSQEKKPDEIIIVDDDSSVKVSDLLKKLSLGEEIKIIIERFESSKGGNVARNRGAALASGDILMFLDDDDTWEPPKIRKQVAILESQPDVGLVYSGKLVVSDTNRNSILYQILPKYTGNVYPKILYENFIGTTSSVAVRKTIFEEAGRFDEELLALQDYDLWIRCCSKTLVQHDNQCNIRYTISDQTGTQVTSQTYRHIQAVEHILEKYKDEINSQGILEARQIRASLFYLVAKSKRKSSIHEAIPWMLKSLIYFPNLRAIIILLPNYITQWIRHLKN